MLAIQELQQSAGDVLIEGGLFSDTITLNGTLKLLGGALTIDGSPTPEIPLVGQDQVTLDGLVDTQGGDVTVDAAKITLTGGTVSTRKFDMVAPSVSTGDSGDVSFTGVTILLEPNSALLADVGGSSTLQAGDVTLSVAVLDLTGALPIDVIPSTNPSITLASGAVITGGNVELTAEKVNQTQTSLFPLTLLSIKDTTLAQGMSIAVTDSVTQSNSTVDPAVSIDATGTVTVNAIGTVSNEASAGTYVFLDGSGAISLAVGNDKSDIKATVNGTIKAGAVRFGDTGADADKLDPSSFDLVNRSINLEDHGFQPGQKILLAGEEYRIIVVDENTIQLAKGEALELDATGTDDNATQTLTRVDAKSFEPATDVDAITNVITLAGHGLQNGQTVTYHTLTSGGADIAGLTGGEDYFVFRVDADHLKLATDVEPEGSSPETFTVGSTTYYLLDLADTSALKTTMPFDPSANTPKGEPVFDDATDSIVFNADDDFYSGQQVTYTAATPIAGLTNGGIYYIIKLAGASDRVQLASSKNNALAAVPVPLPLGPAAGSGVQSLPGRHLHALSFEDTSGKVSFNPKAAINDTDTNTQGDDDTDVGTTLTFDALRTEPVVDLLTSTLFLPNHGFLADEVLTYASDDADPIGGLTSGEDYKVIVVNENHVQLAVIPSNSSDPLVPILFTSRGSMGYGSHSLSTIRAPETDAYWVTFNPTLLPTVDEAADTITIQGQHGYKMGDRVTYLTAGGNPIGGLEDGTDYLVTVTSPSSFQLTDTNNQLVQLTAGGATEANGEAHGFEHAAFGERNRRPDRERRDYHRRSGVGEGRERCRSYQPRRGHPEGPVFGYRA